MTTTRKYEETRRVDQPKSNTPKKKWQRRNTGQLVVWSARTTGRVHKKLGRWKCSKHRDASSSSRELLSDLRGKVISGKYSIFTHFPNDRNYDICLRTKITTASCRKRTATVVSDRKMLVIQKLRIAKFSVKDVNLETIIDTLLWHKTWQHSGHDSYPFETKTSQETQKELIKVLGTDEEIKSQKHYNSLEFCKYCEDPSWNHCTSNTKYSISLVWCEDFIRKTIRNIISWSD